MRKAWLLALLLTTGACERQSATPADKAPMPFVQTAVAATRISGDAAPGSGQERAEDAGRALLGQAAPAVVAHTIDGQTVDLAKLYGRKPVYLKFWATWCVPCRQQMPAFEKDYETLGDKMTVIAVNTGFNDTEARVRAYREQFGLRMPIVIDDGALASALNLRVTPQHVVIGRDGRVLYVGHLEDERLHQAFDAALRERGADIAGRKAAADPVFAVGDRPHDLSATTMDGQAVSLDGPDHGGRLRALVFFSPWCESYLAKSRPAASEDCRRTRETVNGLAAQDQVRWLGVSSGLWANADDLQEYRKSTGTKIPLTLDASGRLFRAFGVRDVPTVVLIDQQGRIVAKLGPNHRDLAARIHAEEKTS